MGNSETKLKKIYERNLYVNIFMPYINLKKYSRYYSKDKIKKHKKYNRDKLIKYMIDKLKYLKKNNDEIEEAKIIVYWSDAFYYINNYKINDKDKSLIKKIFNKYNEYYRKNSNKIKNIINKFIIGSNFLEKLHQETDFDVNIIKVYNPYTINYTFGN